MTKNDIGFTCSGSTDYLAGSGVQLRVDARRRRAVAADPGEPRRDGRRVGAVRGVGEAAARRDRHRARLQLRQVVTRTDARGAEPPTRPVLRGAVVARHDLLAALQARALLEAGKATEKDFADVVARSRKARARQPARATRVGQAAPTTCSPRTDARRPAAQGRLPADHRRRRRRGDRRRRRRPRPLRAAGVDPGHRPPHRVRGARSARPHRLAVDPHAGEKAGSAPARSTSPSCTRRSATKS